jgi:hypothetical protein
VPSGDVNDGNPGIVAVTRLLKVPIGIQVDAMVVHTVTENSNNQLYYGLLSSLLDANNAPAIFIHDIVIYTGSADSAAASTISREVTTNTSGQIRSRLSVSTAFTTETITTLGWIDTRGRL